MTADAPIALPQLPKGPGPKLLSLGPGGRLGSTTRDGNEWVGEAVRRRFAHWSLTLGQGRLQQQRRNGSDAVGGIEERVCECVGWLCESL